MTEELEQILSQLTQPDNAIIQQVTSQIILLKLTLALLCPAISELFEMAAGDKLADVC